MTNSADHNSWGDYLATPPNMCYSPPRIFPDALRSSLQPPSAQMIPEEQVQSLIQPSITIFPQNARIPSNQHEQQFSGAGEIENRTLLITNANPDTTSDDILDFFNQSGEISKFDTSRLDQGIFMVEFFDIRKAMNAKLLKNKASLRGNSLSISYAPLPPITDPKKPPNNGTIVIFHLPIGIVDDQIEAVFSQFGEIRQIRGTPTKTEQRFVEFWDTRAAEIAVMSMNGKYVMGSRVSIEFSLPGGFRRGAPKVDSSYHPPPLIQKPGH